MRKMEQRSKQPSHSILSSGIRNLRPATTSLSHCSQTTRCNSVVRTGRSTNSLYRANRNQQDRKSRTPSISSRRRPVFPLPGLVIGGDENGRDLIPGVQEKAAANRSNSDQVVVGP